VDVAGNEDPNVTSVGPVQSINNLSPLPVTTLTAQDTPNDNGGSIDLDWSGYTPPADAASYNVYRSTSSFTNVGAMTPIQTIGNPATQTYTDNTTTDLTDYHYAITCVDVAGNEDPNVTSVGPVQSINNLPPSAVTVLAQDTPSDDGGSIDLDWSAYSPPADADHYNVYRSTSSFTNVASATLIGTVPTPATKTYTDATTTDGVDYHYAVTCVDVAGNKDPNVTSVGPVQSVNNLPPLDVTTLAAQDTPNDDGGSIDLDWAGYVPPADADHYNVYRSTSSFTNVASATLIGTVGTPATTTYTDATTTDGVDYHYAVTCLDVAGNEDPSVTAVGPVQSVNNLPPAAITTLTAQDTPNDVGGSIDLSWAGYTPPADIDHYDVYRSESEIASVVGLTPIDAVAAPADSYTDTTPVGTTLYYYAVVPVDVAGNQVTDVTDAGPVCALDNLAPLVTHDFRQGLRLITMPATPADPDLTLQDIFSTTLIAAWDAVAQQYVYYQSNPTHPLLRCAAGVGLWVDFSFHVITSFHGRGASTLAPFERVIEPDWNLAANPWLVDMPWSSVTPSPAGSARRFAWIYDPDTGYQLVSAIPSLGAATAVPAYRGFWIQGHANADKLIMSQPGATGWSAQAQARSAAQAIRWRVPVVVSAAGQRDACNAIGQADAPLVIDNPPAVSGAVDAYLTPPSAPDSRAAYELRAVSGGSQIYDLTVVTGMPNTDVAVSLPDLSQLPKDRALVLRDLDGGAATYVRTTRSYTFNSGAQAGTRRFALEVRPAAQGALRITGLSARPSRGGPAEIRFAISQPAAVSVRIHNVAGRLVTVLQQARLAARGTVTCLWDGRSAMGTAAPNGPYVIEVSAASDDGQRARSVYPLTLRR